MVKYINNPVLFIKVYIITKVNYISIYNFITIKIQVIKLYVLFKYKNTL